MGSMIDPTLEGEFIECEDCGGVGYYSECCSSRLRDDICDDCGCESEMCEPCPKCYGEGNYEIPN